MTKYPVYRIYTYSGTSTLEKASSIKKFFEYKEISDAMDRVKKLQTTFRRQIILIKVDAPYDSEIAGVFNPI